MPRDPNPLMQTHLALPIPPTSTNLPPTPPNSEESLETDKGITGKMTYARPRTQSAASISTEVAFGCQKGSVVFESLKDGIPANDIAIGYAVDGGRHRFPLIPATPYDYATSYSGRFQELHPGRFDIEDFQRHWNSSPIVLQAEDVRFGIERRLRGIRFHGTLTNRAAINQVVHRGTVFVINGKDNPDVKYLATYRRDLNTENSMVQINAFMKTQDRIRSDHADWPTITLVIPNSLCDVPIPARLVYLLRHKFRPVQGLVAANLIIPLW
ncbi:hypothetical protein GALMADRAFT_133549 [Galerina marginata CBS 339.88]|uniref:Uncharacterized protein n=1 Tax=Galerina marginata (strain CBS 339.88) TaxID=685588 RepID=A0A067TPD8_GALM3|nr:hypothetical protein GALMADRAFT_133549 [Galerina marginata CBS 339.88]